MASDIHKKRTGKGFRISEEVVLNEEMYEEDDEDLPRLYHLLGAHLQTSSAAMNVKLEKYISQEAAMSSLLAKNNEDWRENEINKLFELHFGKITSNLPRRQPQPRHENDCPHQPAQRHQILPVQQSQVYHQPLKPIPMYDAMTLPSDPQPETSISSSPTTFLTSSATPQASQMSAHTMGLHTQGRSRGHSMSSVPPSFLSYTAAPKRCTSEMPQTEPFAQFTGQVRTESPIDLAPSQSSAFTHDGLSSLYSITQQASDDSEMGEHIPEWLNATAGHTAIEGGKLDACSTTESLIGMEPGMVPVDVMALPVEDPCWLFIDDSILFGK